MYLNPDVMLILCEQEGYEFKEGKKKRLHITPDVSRRIVDALYAGIKDELYGEKITIWFAHNFPVSIHYRDTDYDEP